jgi:hypothetical protein
MKRRNIAVLLSAVLVGLLVLGSVVSDDVEIGDAQVNVSGIWIVETQDIYLSSGPLSSGTHAMRLYQSGDDVVGTYVLRETLEHPELRGAITGEVCDNDTLALTCITVAADGYIGITKMKGTISLNDTISGTHLGSDNFEKVWECIFNANRSSYKSIEDWLGPQ